MIENYIIGSGGFAKEVYCILKRNNKKVDGFISLTTKPIKVQNKEYTPILQEDFLKSANPNKANLYFGIGNPSIITSLNQKYLKFKFPNLLDPQAKIIGSVSMGQGNIFCCNCIFTTDIEIGSFNIFNIACTIGHDTKIQDCNVFNPTTCISGNVNIGSNNLFGVNSTVLQNIKICSNNIIGANALVTKDVTETGIYTGIPAKRKD